MSKLKNKVKINVNIISEVLTMSYSKQLISKSLFRSLASSLLKEEYKTVAIYFYKRKLIEFDPYVLLDWLKSNEFNMSKSLFISFESKANKFDYHDLTMYVIKNDHCSYIYNDSIVHNVRSLRREHFLLNHNKP